MLFFAFNLPCFHISCKQYLVFPKWNSCIHFVAYSYRLCLIPNNITKLQVFSLKIKVLTCSTLTTLLLPGFGFLRCEGEGSQRAGSVWVVTERLSFTCSTTTPHICLTWVIWNFMIMLCDRIWSQILRVHYPKKSGKFKCSFKNGKSKLKKSKDRIAVINWGQNISRGRGQETTFWPGRGTVFGRAGDLWFFLKRFNQNFCLKTLGDPFFLHLILRMWL